MSSSDEKPPHWPNDPWWPKSFDEPQAPWWPAFMLWWMSAMKTGEPQERWLAKVAFRAGFEAGRRKP